MTALVIVWPNAHTLRPGQPCPMLTLGSGQYIAAPVHTPLAEDKADYKASDTCCYQLTHQFQLPQ